MNHLLPPPELGPPLSPQLSAEQRIEVWIDMMRFGDACFIAGARHRLKSGRDVLEAARESYARHMADQDDKLLSMAARFEECHGR